MIPKTFVSIFPLFIIFFSFLQLHVLAYNIFVFEESEQGLSTKTGTGQDFTDGTILLQLVRRINDSCNEPTSFIRLVKPDLNVTRIDVALPPDSYYQVCNTYGGDKVYVRVLDPPLFLVSYMNTTTIGPNTTYQRIALIMDYDGVIRKYVLNNHFVPEKLITNQKNF